MSEKRYVYVVEWFDTQASVIRKFYFTYYLPDHLIEMVRVLLLSVRPKKPENLPEENQIPVGDSRRPLHRERVHVFQPAAQGDRLRRLVHPQIELIQTVPVRQLPNPAPTA